MKTYKVDLTLIEIATLIELLEKYPPFHMTVKKLYCVLKGIKNDED